jgi:hypothetical protein
MSKILSVAFLAGLLLGVSVPISAYAAGTAGTPTTKAACEKAGMKWDAAKKACHK